jgi:hypothetical protein
MLRSLFGEDAGAIEAGTIRNTASAWLEILLLGVLKQGKATTSSHRENIPRPTEQLNCI